MKKKLLTALLVGGMLALVGCGKDAKVNPEEVQTTEEEVVTTTEATTTEDVAEDTVTTTEEEVDPTKTPYTEAYKTVYLGEKSVDNVEYSDYMLSVESGAETGTVYVHTFITEVRDYMNVDDYLSLMSCEVGSTDTDGYYGRDYEYGTPKLYYTYEYDYDYRVNGVTNHAVVTFLYTVEDLDETKLICYDRDGEREMPVNSTLEELTCINPEVSEHKTILSINNELYFMQLGGSPSGQKEDGVYFNASELDVVCCLDRPFDESLSMMAFTVDNIENVDFLLCKGYEDNEFKYDYIEPEFSDKLQKYVGIDGVSIQYGYTSSVESFWQEEGYLEPSVPIITIDGKTTTVYPSFLQLDIND